MDGRGEPVKGRCVGGEELWLRKVQSKGVADEWQGSASDVQNDIHSVGRTRCYLDDCRSGRTEGYCTYCTEYG